MINPKQIRTDAELDAALARIGELLTSEPGSPQYDELNALSDLVKAYENKHYPIGLPSLARRHRVSHGATQLNPR